MDDFKYKNYTDARNASWQVIIDMGINSLPVDVFKLARDLGINVMPYRKSKLFMFCIGLLPIRHRHDAMYVSVYGKRYIFYNDKISNEGRLRFTIAHEIGHHILGHISSGYRIIPVCAERSKKAKRTTIESEANIFASRLLAPSIVLHTLDATTPEDIVKLCGMSYQAATYRSERLGELDERNCYNIDELERRVLSNFTEYIDANKKQLIEK